MVPADYRTVPALPRTAAGKLDRRALLDVDAAPFERATTPDSQVEAEASARVRPDATRAPTTAERILLEIWKDVLGLEEIGLDEDFFQIGGDSLMSIRVISRAGARGLKVSAEDFFDRPTVAGMARGLSQQSSSGTDAGSRNPVVGRARLTPIQHCFPLSCHVRPDR